MNNTFTIVTPSYNQGEFIADTIKSVVSQAGNFSIEYIIADGGSTDNTVKIIEQYDDLIKRGKIPCQCRGLSFKWWSRPDKGQSHAINQGLKSGSGEICTWLNSDDYFTPGSLDRVIKYWQKHKVDFLYGDAFVYYQDTGKTVRDSRSRIDFHTLLKEGNMIHQPASFFSRRLISEIGWLDEDLHYMMDYDMILRSFNRYKYKYLPEALAVFRSHPEAKTRAGAREADKEIQKVRFRYGGKRTDPSYIHFLRTRIPGTAFIKERFPRVFRLGRTSAYWLASIFKIKKT